jgi:hypothetical protein
MRDERGEMKDGTGIFAVQLAKPFEALVDVHIVDQKVNQTVNGNPNAYKQQPTLWSSQANHVRNGTGYGKNEKKKVIF